MKTTTIAIAAILLLTAWQGDDFRKDFPVDKARLGTTGANPYFVLVPGVRLTYEHGAEKLVTTILNETKMVDGVEARVVEDRETKNGQPTEITRDYYAIDRVTRDVYYMGEDVDTYKNGKVVDHKGSWLSGVKGAKFGMIMPGELKVGLKFYQELASGIGMDRAEIVSKDETVKVPAGTYKNCVHIKETSAMEAGVVDHKWFAPGIGMIKENQLALIRIEKQ